MYGRGVALGRADLGAELAITAPAALLFDTRPDRRAGTGDELDAPDRARDALGHARIERALHL